MKYQHTPVHLLLSAQVGDVLVSNRRTRTFEFVNNGGDGRFMLLTADQWASMLQHGLGNVGDSSTAAGTAAGPEACTLDDMWLAAASSSAAAAADAAAVSSGPFSISPAYLDLTAGAAGRLLVRFSPVQPGHQAEDFMLVCDNCTAHPLQVEGSGATVQVELVGVDDRQWLQQDEEVPLWCGEVRQT